LSNKDQTQKIIEILKEEFPIVETPLIHKNAFQLLAATMLSAQTLDTTTNKVTPNLFQTYPTIKDLAKANPEDIEKIIKIVNYYKTKSKNLVKMANILIEKFNGEVPKSIENLLEISGVGRKIANVVISEWFAKRPEFNMLPEGFVVDTHVKRVSYRLGLTKHTDPKKIEQDLMRVLPKKEWTDTSLRLIFHGRKVCKSQRPLCEICPLKRICPRVGVKITNY